MAFKDTMNKTKKNAEKKAKKKKYAEKPGSNTPAKISDVVKVTPTKAVNRKAQTATKSLPKSYKETKGSTVAKLEAQKRAGRQWERSKSAGLDSSSLTPLNLLKRDAISGTTTRDKILYARTSGAVGRLSASEVKARNKKAGEERAARDQKSAAQVLSKHDKGLSKRDQTLIRDAKTSYDEAREKGDKAGMQEAHKRAETIRKGYGYSGGTTGEDYISPDLSKEETAMLTQDGQRKLKRAKMDLEAAQKAGDERKIAEVEAAVARIIGNNANRKEGFKKVDGYEGGNGQPRSKGAIMSYRDWEDRAYDGVYSVMSAVPGSILSLVETSNQAIENDFREKNWDYINDKANRLQEYKTKLELAKKGEWNPEWGSIAQLEQQVKIAERAEKMRSAGTTVDPNLPGQTLMRKSAEAQQKFMEGRTGVDKLLASATLSIGQMVPALAASAIPGVGPAIGAGIMGAQAAGSKAYELNERGVDPAEAQLRGLVSGGIESLTEKIPISNLLKVVKAGGGASLIKSMAKQAGIEATEESISYALNYAADVANKDPEARFSMKDLLDSAAVGAISGGAFGGIGSVAGRKLYGGQPQETAQPSRLERLGQQALMQASGLKERLSPPAETAQDAAEDISAPIDGYTPAQDKIEQKAEETPRESFNRRYQDVMARIQAAAEDPAQKTPEVYAALSSELQSVMEEGNRLTQQERQDAGLVSQNFGETESHIDNRTSGDMGDRSVKAFQFDHPQLHQYYVQAAEALKRDAEYSFETQRSERGNGTVVRRSEQLERAESMGLTRNEIIRVCDDIIADNGQENYAAAKRVELILDDMLSRGYIPNEGTTEADTKIPANEAYIHAKNQIPGAVTGFDRYKRDNSLALDLGEVTDEELRAEYEAGLPEGQGAMSPGASGDFAHWQSQRSDFHPINQKSAARAAELYGRAPVEVPRVDMAGRLTSKTISTLANAGITNNQFAKAMEEDAAGGWLSRLAYTDQQAQQAANEKIRDLGFQRAKEAWIADAKAGKLSKDNTVLGLTLINHAANSGTTEGHIDAHDLLSYYVNYAKTAGQALQAMNMVNKMSPVGQLYSVINAVERMEEQSAERGKPANVTINDALVSSFLEAETQEERNEIKKDIIADAAAQLPVTWQNRFNAWRYFAMLANPTTHARNFMGNAGFAAVRGVKDVTAAGLERAFGIENRTNAVINRFSAEDRARLAIATSEFADVQDIILSGGKYTDDYSLIAQAQDPFQSEKPILKQIGKVISWGSEKNTKALDFEDKIFSKSAYARSLAAYLKANNVTAEEYAKMKEGDDSGFVEKAQAHAIKEAQKATYRDLNEFSEAISKLGKLQYSSNKFVKGTGILVEGTLPFKKTPANILARGVEYSPIGLAKGIIDMETKVRRGEMEAAEAIDELAAGLTGTGLFALGCVLGYLGLVTGGASDDEKQKRFDALQGSQNYALEIGNLSITLDWLAPEALPFFVGVEFYKFMQQGKNGEVTASNLGEALGHIAEPMLEMSMLQGLNDLFNTLGSDYPLSAAAWTAATSYLTQFIPTVLGRIERLGESTRQTTFIDKNSPLPAGMQYLLGNIGNKLPGEFQQIDYIDQWGRTEDTGNVLIRALNNFLNPAYTSKRSTSQTEQELQRLYDAGFDFVFPGLADKATKINGEYVTADQWVDMQTERGKTAKSALDNFIGTEQYNAMTDEEKAKFVKYVLDYAADRGKVKAGASADETFARWQEAAQNAKAAVGLGEEVVIAANAYKSVLEENAGDETRASIKQGMFEQWVNNRTDLTDTQKTYIKNNLKVWQMMPADASSYNKAVAAGYTDPKEIQALFENRKNYDLDGDGSYTSNAEILNYISSATEDPEEREKMWNALKGNGEERSYAQLEKEYRGKVSAIQTAKSRLDEVVSAEKQSAFASAASGADSQKKLKKALLSVDATEEERIAYYNLQSAKRGWKRSWYNVKMN